MIIVDVAERLSVAQAWAKGHGFTFPVLWDSSGSAAAQYAPEGVLPDLPRFQIPIGSNLLLDREGMIVFYTLLDTKNFDARLVALRSVLDSLLAVETDTLGFDQMGPGAQRVKIGSLPSPFPMKVGQALTLAIPLSVKDGVHVQANPAGMENLIPLQVRLSGCKEVEVGAPVYPPGDRFRLAGSDFDLLVYSDSVQISLPVKARASSAGMALPLEGWIVYQSCDDRSCFPPDSLAFSLSVLVE